MSGDNQNVPTDDEDCEQLVEEVQVQTTAEEKVFIEEAQEHRSPRLSLKEICGEVVSPTVSPRAVVGNERQEQQSHDEINSQVPDQQGETVPEQGETVPEQGETLLDQQPQIEDEPPAQTEVEQPQTETVPEEDEQVEGEAPENQARQEPLMWPSEKQQENFEESEIQDKPREDRSEIGELVDTLQEFRAEAPMPQYDIEEVLVQNQQLMQDKDELQRLLDAKNVEMEYLIVIDFRMLYNQIEQYKNQIKLLTNVESSNLFQDVSSISANNRFSQPEPYQKDYTIYEVLNASQNVPFKESWVVATEKSLSHNELFKPFLKKNKQISPMDYVSRKPFSIGKLPSLKRKRKTHDRSVTPDSTPFSQKFLQHSQSPQHSKLIDSRVNPPAKRVPDVDIKLLHEQQRISMELKAVQRKIQRVKQQTQTQANTHNDSATEEEIDRLLAASNHQESFTVNGEYEIVTHAPHRPTDVNDEQVDQVVDQVESIYFRPLQIEKQDSKKDVQVEPPQQKPSYQAQRYAQQRILAAKPKEAPPKPPPNPGFHTFNESQFPLLAQKQSYYNKALSKQVINPSTSTTVMRHIERPTAIQVASPRDSNFRQTPGFNLK